MLETPAGRENDAEPSPGSATTISSDFAIPSDLESTQRKATAVPSEPVVVAEAQPPLVVIEYRYRGAPSWLVLTLVLVAVALGIVSYRRLTPPPALHRIQQSLASRTPAARDSSPLGVTTKAAPATADSVSEPLFGPVDPPPDRGKATAEGPVTPAVPLPAPPILVAKTDDVSRDDPALQENTGAPAASGESTSRPKSPEHHPIGVDTPQPTRASPPTEQSEPAAAPGAPAVSTAPVFPAEEPRSAPSPPPPVSNDEIERNIAKESEQRQAELDMMRQAKGDARRIEQQETVRQVYDQRLAFHRELREIVQKGGATAGQQIDGLCEQYGRDVPAEQRKAVSRRLRALPERSTRQDRVALLRAHNIPEPVILDDLARYLTSRLKNARGGVRSSDEVLVKAAQQLLALPLPAGNAGAQPRTR